MKVIIEMGGTKVNIFTIGPSGVPDQSTIPTSSPSDFKNHISARFRDQKVSRIIFACFGPLSLAMKDYGTILNTSKPGWKHTNIYDWLKQHLCEDICLVTDATLSALGAMQKYKLQEAFFSYVTIGTGIGGYNVFKGDVLQNETHPEIGHMYLELSEKNICEYHGHCFE